MIQKSPFDYKGRAIFKPGFHLQEHSVAQIEQANSHLEMIIGKRPLNTEEIRWIRNERAMCSISFSYWATRYAFIIDWGGQLSRFKPNLPQQVILDELSTMEGREIAMIVQILKARQEGVTTLSELIMLWISIFHPYSNTLVASSRPDKSKLMVEKMEFCYAKQPKWLVPPVESYNAGELIGFDSIHSTVNIRHGAMMSGMGRGATTFSFHLSEVTEFQNPHEAIDGALLKSIHDTPWIVGILESTGMGRYGWYYDNWKNNVEFWPQGMGKMCPIFLPYYILRDIYPTDSWLRAHPVPKEWDVPDFVRSHAARATAYVQSGQNQIVTRVLGSTWELPVEQQWFWYVSHEQAVRDKKLNLFYQELCADDSEAFQNPNSTIFSSEITDQFRNSARMPYGVYGIKASQAEIPIQFQAHDPDIDPSRPPIDIRADWMPNGQRHDYRLVPLLHRGAAPFSPTGKIIMYEPPHSGEFYAVGTDTGYGLGADSSVIQIVRKGSAERNDEQVLEFASPQLNSYTLWPFNLALGTLYSTNYNGKRRQARQVIEGAANGENVHNELKKRGWREFHNWVRYDKKKILEFKANRELWYTTSWSRPLMFDMLLDALNNGWLDINSPWFIEEMENLEVIVEGRQKIAAAVGAHDDRIMALGIALFSLHALETRSHDGWARRRARDNEDDVIRDLSYSPGSQGGISSEYLAGPETSYAYKVISDHDPSADELRGLTQRGWSADDFYDR